MDIKTYTQEIEKAIKALPLPTEGPLKGLYAPIAYGLDAGGKRLRPVLTLVAAEALGAPAKEAMPAALAVEMFHNFTLLHDDVMDNSPTRRGKPSVMAAWDVNTAILSGDTLYGLCYNQLLRLRPEVLARALARFQLTAIGVFEGQQYDVDFETRDDVTLPEYIEMIRLKTSVLLGGAAALGAIVAGASLEQEEALYRYAECLGLAFQIQDDLLDVYGDAATFGKPIGGDILNAKKTWLLLTALAHPEGFRVAEAMALPPSQEKINIVRNLYDRLGIKALAEAAIDDYTSQAVEALASLNLPAPYADLLSSLALSLAHRSK